MLTDKDFTFAQAMKEYDHNPAAMQKRVLEQERYVKIYLCFCFSIRFYGKPASWSRDNVFVSGAGGLRFESWFGLIGHSATNGLPALLHFFKGGCVALRHSDADLAPPTCYTFWRNTGCP